VEEAFDTVDRFGDGLPQDLDWLVIDHPAPDARIVGKLGHGAHARARIADADCDDEQYDLVLNPNLTASIAEPTQHPPRYLGGPSFALVRAEFPTRRHKAKPPETRKAVRRVLVTPGATDAAAISQTLISRLLQADLAVRMPIARAGGTVAELEAIARRSAGRFELLVDASAAEMAEALSDTDLVLGNAGGGAWERCTLGVPSVVTIMADDQVGNAQALVERQAAVYGGDARKADAMQTIWNGLQQVQAAPAKLADLSRHAFAITDGLGAYRMAQAMFPFRTSAGEAVELRPAETTDCKRLYDWQNLPETRRYARNPSAPDWDTHCAWFQAKLVARNSLLNIVEADRKPIGAVALDLGGVDRDRPVYEVSIYLDPRSMGKGIGLAALTALAAQVPFAVLTAYVLPQNERSIRLFARAGYRTNDGMNFRHEPQPATKHEDLRHERA
jgi:spore coat polysaccharide biosynthesis predicted glycosyltransferase SpsG/RimJ/RimL family protein N-acetyltransferase